MGGGNSILFIAVMVGLFVVMLATFVLRPSLVGLDARVLIYAVRLGVVLVALVFGSRHPLHRGAAGAGADDAADPFADSSASSDAKHGAGGGGGPKIMEFNWATTQRAP